jgi:AraC-like DNA-binding protein
MCAAQQLLTESDLKISCIGQEVGYRSHSAFARHFKSVTGSTLTMYRGSRNDSTAVRVRLSAERASIDR